MQCRDILSCTISSRVTLTPSRTCKPIQRVDIDFSSLDADFLNHKLRYSMLAHQLAQAPAEHELHTHTHTHTRYNHHTSKFSVL